MLIKSKVHAFSSRSGNLNFGHKLGYKINLGFGPGSGLHFRVWAGVGPYNWPSFQLCSEAPLVLTNTIFVVK